MSTFQPTNIPNQAGVLSSPLRNNFNALMALLNGGLGVDQFADGALPITKTDLSTGTPTSPIVNNNVPYKAKDAGGTPQNVIKLGADSIVRLGQVEVSRKGSGGSMVNAITDNQVMCRGMFWIQAAAATNVTAAIAFPVTFDDVEWDLLITPIGTRVTAPGFRNDQDGNSELFLTQVVTGTRTTSGCTIVFYTSTGGNFGTTRFMMCSYVLIGTKA